MNFSFFKEIQEKGCTYLQFKKFCDEFTLVLNLKIQKKLVDTAHKTYIKSLNNYNKAITYGAGAIEDVDKCAGHLDNRHKKYLKKTIQSEYKVASLKPHEINPDEATNIINEINSKVKSVLIWDYK